MSNKVIPDYTMVEKEDVDYYAFRFDEGQYEGVVFYYGAVKVEEDVENDQALLQFDFQVDKGNEVYSIEELEKSKDFRDILGDVLVSILDTEEDCEEDND